MSSTNVEKSFTSWLSSVDSRGAYVRKPSQFRSCQSITTVTGDRYHLYVSYACPWAHRVLFTRAFFGLEHVLTVDVVDPFLSSKGWAFHRPPDAPAYRPGVEENDHRDSVNDFRFLREIYLQSNPDYDGNITVPVLYDKVAKQIVNNESADIIRILNADFRSLATKNATHDLYPEALRKEIDMVNDFVYDKVNNGVYKCGFARSQEAYNDAVKELFQALDRLEDVLGKQRYLAGAQMTEADIRLFTTLVRFDSVYHTHFKCNQRTLSQYPNLLDFCRELYQMEGISATVNDPHIRFHYYQSHTTINPTQIVPPGPQTDFSVPHSREKLSHLQKK